VSDPLDRPPNVPVAYYSATGHVHALAKAVGQGAEDAGAEAGELWGQGKLISKVATSFTSSQTDHGGQESTILALNNTFYHLGAIVLPLGYTATPPECSAGSAIRFGDRTAKLSMAAAGHGDPWPVQRYQREWPRSSGASSS
jgi:multimeric flavodoxin WrbA